MFRNSVHKGVMKVIKQKIAQAEKAHEEDCQNLEEQYQQDLVDALDRRDHGKEISLDKHINSIVGNIL